MSEADLAARIGRLEDRVAIGDLISTYSLCVDDHDFDGLAKLWHADAIYGWRGAPPAAQGAAAIATLLESRISSSGPSFHVNHDHVVEFGQGHADQANGFVFAHVEASVGGRQVQSAIRYYDRYIRHEGQWLFAARELAFLYSVPSADYASVLTRSDRMLSGPTPGPAHWPDF